MHSAPLQNQSFSKYRSKFSTRLVKVQQQFAKSAKVCQYFSQILQIQLDDFKVGRCPRAWAGLGNRFSEARGVEPPLLWATDIFSGLYRIISQASENEVYPEIQSLMASFWSPSSGDRSRQIMRDPGAKHLLSAAPFAPRVHFSSVSIFVVRLVFGRSLFRPSNLGRFQRFPSSESREKTVQVC